MNHKNYLLLVQSCCGSHSASAACRSWVSNSPSTRFCYAACGHVGRIWEYHKKLNTLLDHQVFYILVIFTCAVHESAHKSHCGTWQKKKSLAVLCSLCTGESWIFFVMALLIFVLCCSWLEQLEWRKWVNILDDGRWCCYCCLAVITSLLVSTTLWPHSKATHHLSSAR